LSAFLFVFFLKKLLSRFLFPVPLCAELLVLGLLLWSFTKWKKLGRGLVVAGTLLLLTFSYPWLPRLALSQLESQYPPLGEDGGQGLESRKRPEKQKLGKQKAALRKAEIGKAESRNLPDAESRGRGLESRKQKAESRNLPDTESRGRKTEAEAPRFIMVLGQGLSADTNRLAAARFGDEGLMRVFEGVRLHRLLTNSTLLVSVAGPTVTQEEKERVLGELLLVFGLQTNAVQVCAGAWDTEDEVRWCKTVVGTNRVIIVSSASHLPRAMLLARKHGLNPVAAPSGFLVDTVTQSPFTPDRLFPGSVNLYLSERAMYEYLGLVWEWVRGGLTTGHSKR
jgi:uncharacterized SAM-binding protein YcdF (DUF218 family)